MIPYWMFDTNFDTYRYEQLQLELEQYPQCDPDGDDEDEDEDLEPPVQAYGCVVGHSFILI